MLWWWGEKQGDKSKTDEAERWEAARLDSQLHNGYARSYLFYHPGSEIAVWKKKEKKNRAADFSKKCKKKERKDCSEFLCTHHSRWQWRFSLLHFLFHLFNSRSLGGHGVFGGVGLAAHVVKWNTFRPALALRWSGRGGGGGVDALGFARPNELHKPWIWDVEIKGLHKQCSLICLENKWAQVMSTSISGIINVIHPSTMISI